MMVMIMHVMMVNIMVLVISSCADG